MAITFDKPNRVIFIPSPETEVLIQDLINAIRDYEEELDNLDIPTMANASGKQDLGGGTLVGITLELLDDWRVQFENRAGPNTEAMSISGGNIVATNSYSNNPVKPSTFTQINIARSSSATISRLDVEQIITDIWNEQVDDHQTVGSFGHYVKNKILSVGKFIGLK